MTYNGICTSCRHFGNCSCAESDIFRADTPKVGQVADCEQYEKGST